MTAFSFGVLDEVLGNKYARPRDSWPLVLTSSLIGGLRDDIIVPN